MGKRKGTFIEQRLETNEPSPRESMIRPRLSERVVEKFNHLGDKSKDTMCQPEIKQRSRPSFRRFDGNQFHYKLMIIFVSDLLGLLQSQ